MDLQWFRKATMIAATLAASTAISADCATRVKLDSISPEYPPTAGVEMPEPVSMQSFAFEINKQTQRARIVVDYTYPDQLAFGAEGGRGPEPTIVQLPGLKYDSESNAVVYDTDGRKTVCATVRQRKFLFWKSVSVAATGSCVVTSALTDHTDDNGWSISHVRTIDTYLEIH